MAISYNRSYNFINYLINLGIMVRGMSKEYESANKKSCFNIATEVPQSTANRNAYPRTRYDFPEAGSSKAAGLYSSS